MTKADTISFKPVVKNTHGLTSNQTTSPFFKPSVQPKLSVNQPGDKYEQEADTMADKVMRMPGTDNSNSFFKPLSASINPLQRKCAECEQEELQRKEKGENEASVLQKHSSHILLQRKCAACQKEERESGNLQLKTISDETIHRKCNDCEKEEQGIQRKESGHSANISSSVDQTLRSSGQPIDAETRSFMESRFSYDFSTVQIHNDPLAHRSSADINALAFTHGSHIVFGAGQYQPQTSQGKKLLAHELTHVVQQNASAPLSRVHSPVIGKGNEPVIQRQELPEEMEAAFEEGEQFSCPRVPTGEGDETPTSLCPVATYTGASEVKRFNFCNDSSELTETAQLSELSAIVKSHHPSTKFLIHGYASKEGRKDYNFRLACHRANKIASALAAIMQKNKANAPQKKIDAEIAQRIETGAQGPTSQFEGGLEANRIAIVYAQEPGNKKIEEPSCEDAPRRIGNIKPEIDCDLPTIDLSQRNGSPQLKHFHFCLDSDVLVSESASDIRAFAYEQAANAVFFIHGFSSEEGEAAYNKRLSCHRALRIARELTNAGVSPNQIQEVSGLGETAQFSFGDPKFNELNRVAVVFAQGGEIGLLKDDPREANTPEQKNAIVKEAVDRIMNGQYRLQADAYISFWTCGRTKTLRQAVERLRILLPEGNKDELIREQANGKEEGLGVNTIQLSNTSLHSDNPVECVIGRIIDMAFHHAVVNDKDLNPDLSNPSNSEPRHLAGLHLISLAGFSSCTGQHAQAGEVPGRGLTGIDEPLAKDPREKIKAPLCSEAPQQTRLLNPAEGMDKRETVNFITHKKQFSFNQGTLNTNLVGDDSGKKFVTKGSTDIMSASAQVSLIGKPETFSDYEIGFIQAILDDLTLAEYFSGRRVLQKLPVPIRGAGLKSDTAVPFPWMSLSASEKVGASGFVSLKTGWNLNTEVALLLNFFRPDVVGKDLLDTFQRHTTVGIWLAARRLGAPLDRFSVFFIDGAIYNIDQHFNMDLRRLKGNLALDETSIEGEKEFFNGTGSFETFETSAEPADSRLAQYGNPSAAGIDINRQFQKILEPDSATEANGMDRTEYAAVVQQILDNLVLFESEEELKKGAAGEVVPRLGFVFSPLKIHITIDRSSGRMLPFLGMENNEPVKVESVALGQRARFHLAKALALRLSKRDFLNQGRGVVLRPSAIPGQGATGTIIISLPPLQEERDLSKDSSVLHDMAELWACSEATTAELDPREFAIVYWMDREGALHRIPEDGILVGEPLDMSSGTITTKIPCGPGLHNTGFALGHVHTHPLDDEDAPLPSKADEEAVKSGSCGNKFYIVSENFVVSYFSDGKQRREGERKSMLSSNVKCDPSRWRQVAVQPKLSVNQPGDKYEQEADAVADKVTRMPDPVNNNSFFKPLPISATPLQRKCAECERQELQEKESDVSIQLNQEKKTFVQRKCSHCEEEKLQRSTATTENNSLPSFSGIQDALSSEGVGMDASTKNFMEERFGYDFSNVQIHNDSLAHQSSADINALAYTHQNHIVFGKGQYQPATDSGKQLLAHELTHVIQQSGANSSALMRKCDPALFAGKTVPTFLPKEKTIVDVFNGSRTLKKKQKEPVAVGIIQQALVDLKFDLGKSGPDKNGVDRDYGDSTAKGVEDFQTKNSLPVNGSEIDADTLKCLDQERISGQPVVSNLGMTRKDLEITGEHFSSGQNIFFTRGSSVLDTLDDATAIEDFIKNNKGAEVTPQGFVSEDEFLEFGIKLAEDRAKNVLKALQDEQVKMKLPAAEELRFKAPVNKEEEGIGVIDYPATRRVHLDITGKVAASGKSCSIIPPDWDADHTGPCDKGDKPGLKASIVDPAIKRAQELLKNTQDGLEKKDKNAKDTVATWFGSEGLLSTVTSKIKKWRKHLDNNLPNKHRCADECHSDCDGTGAYNSETGSAAMMTLCPDFLGITDLDERALVVAHEAGHGSIGTSDVAYDSSRLISVLQTDSSLALKNTDSYIFMIKCFNAIMGGPCKRPDILGNFSSLSASSDKKAEDKTKESIAWLERWTDWVWQDVNVLYGQVSSSRQKGVWPKDDYSIVLKNLNKYFGISRRPAQKSPATLGEEVFVGAMNAKLLDIHNTVERDAKFILDTTGSLSPQWDLSKAPQEITILEGFFKLGPRARVKFLLKLLITATPHIASGLEDSYVNFIDEESKTWFNKP